MRSLLLLPKGATNTKMGGGQRTAVFFNALKQLGPVDVVILGEQPPKRGNHTFFPGAASQQWIPSARFSTRPKNLREKLRHNVWRFLRVQSYYAADPEIERALAQILTEAHQIVVSRYAIPFCVSGLRAQPGLSVYVDVDDRDDQKFQSAGETLLGSKRLTALFERWIVSNIRTALETHLQRANLLWYTAADDALDMSGPEVSILPNVPFGLPEDADITPISETQDILFVGAFAHRPNQDGLRWFLTQCWPTLAQQFEQARLRVVGLGPWDTLRPEFPDVPRVDFVGTAEDIGAEYTRARMVISPVFDGGGSKIKVIEACAYGRPILVSPHSARGFGPEIAQALPQADSPEGFIEICATLLADAEAAQQMGLTLQSLQRRTFSQSAAEAQIVNDIRKHLC